jgi:hypothetical protein
MGEVSAPGHDELRHRDAVRSVELLHFGAQRLARAHERAHLEGDGALRDEGFEDLQRAPEQHSAALLTRAR